MFKLHVEHNINRALNENCDWLIYEIAMVTDVINQSKLSFDALISNCIIGILYVPL